MLKKSNLKLLSREQKYQTVAPTEEDLGLQRPYEKK